MAGLKMHRLGQPRQEAGDVDQCRVVGRQHQPAPGQTLESAIAHLDQPGSRAPPVEGHKVPVNQPLKERFGPLPATSRSTH